MLVITPSDEAFGRDLMAHRTSSTDTTHVIAFIGNTAYRLDSWTLSTRDSRDELHVSWVKESDLVKATTLPWRWRLKWRLRALVRKVV